MTTAIIIPTRESDEWRSAALTYVAHWYQRHFPDVPKIVCNAPTEEWSKGAAIAEGVSNPAAAGADVLVIADADSFMLDPVALRAAIDLVTHRTFSAVTPHRRVYRLRDKETVRLEADESLAPRLGWTVRPVYEGPVGGGITVLSRDAYDTVNGVDPRFLGWGGEDVCFGWALQTLAPQVHQGDGVLVHLWHPHPAPNLRGSAESEALVAQYKSARLVPRRMWSVVRGMAWEPAKPLETPVRFRIRANRTSLRLPTGDVVRFTGGPRRPRYGGTYETTDPDEVTMLRTFQIVTEETR